MPYKKKKMEIIELSVKLIVAFTVILVAYIFLYKNIFPHVAVMDDYAAIKNYGNMSVLDVFLHGGYKYRPISNFIIWIFLKLIGYNIYNLFYANIGINIFIAMTLFCILKKYNNVGALVVSLIYICSRFSYYQITQVHGIMESVALLFGIMVVFFLCKYVETNKKIYFYWALVFYCLDVLSHERYAVLIVSFFGVFLIELFEKEKSKKDLFLKKIIPCIVGGLAIVFIFKLMVDDVLMGTGGQSVSETFSIGSFLSRLKTSFCFVLGINSSETYLSEVAYSSYPRYIRIVVWTTNFSIIIALGVYWFEIIKKKRTELLKELKIAIICFLAIVMLLAISSTTIRIEMRWMYYPYVILAMYLCYVVHNSDSNRKDVKGILFAIFAFGTIILNLYCQQYIGNLYFWRDYSNATQLVECVYDYAHEQGQSHVYDYDYIVISKYNYEYQDAYAAILNQFSADENVEIIRTDTLESAYSIENWDEYVWVWYHEEEYRVYYYPGMI